MLTSLRGISLAIPRCSTEWLQIWPNIDLLYFWCFAARSASLSSASHSTFPPADTPQLPWTLLWSGCWPVSARHYQVNIILYLLLSFLLCKNKSHIAMWSGYTYSGVTVQTLIRRTELIIMEAPFLLTSHSLFPIMVKFSRHCVPRGARAYTSSIASILIAKVTPTSWNKS